MANFVTQNVQATNEVPRMVDNQENEKVHPYLIAEKAPIPKEDEEIRDKPNVAINEKAGIA